MTLPEVLGAVILGNAITIMFLVSCRRLDRGHRDAPTWIGIAFPLAAALVCGLAMLEAKEGRERIGAPSSQSDTATR